MTKPLTKNQALALQRLAKQRRSSTQKKVEKLKREGAHEVGTLNQREFFLAGLALYWGEGYKYGSGEVGFTNNSPAAIRFFIKWVRNVYKIPYTDFVCRVTINKTHQKYKKTIESSWSKITGIPLESFTRAALISTKTKKKYPNQKTYLGTLRVKVRRGTDLHRRIMGSLEHLMGL